MACKFQVDNVFFKSLKKNQRRKNFDVLNSDFEK